MSIGETAPQASDSDFGRLSFGATFGGAFSTVFGQLWLFIKAAILPFVLGILIAIIGAALSSLTPALGAAWQILSLLPLAILGIAYCRIVLLGRQAGAVPRPLFGRRTWVYFGYALLMTLATVLPVFAVTGIFFGDVFFLLDAEVQNPDAMAGRVLAMIPTMFLVYLFFMYVLTRLSLVFPAVSVDQKLGLGGSWRLTRGSNGFKLFAVFIVLTILCFFAALLLTFLISSVFSLFLFLPGITPGDAGQFDILAFVVAAAPTFIIVLALEYLVVALYVAALAGAYAQVSGWGGPRKEILERFE